MAAVTLEPKKIKFFTVSIVSPSISHEVMGQDAMIFVFWMLSFKPTFSLSSTTFIKIALISHASKVMFKILKVRLQQYVNHEIQDVQAGFRKGRGTRDQIANMCWIMEKAREFQKNIYFWFIDYAKAFDRRQQLHLRG